MGPDGQYGASHCHELAEKADTGDQYKPADGCGDQMAAQLTLYSNIFPQAGAGIKSQMV